MRSSELRAHGGYLGTQRRGRACYRRNAAGSWKEAVIRRYPNGATRQGESLVTLS